MTKKEARKLSILKWEWIIKNPDKNADYDLSKEIPELQGLDAECGYCELYHDGPSGGNQRCKECPLAIKPINHRSQCLMDGHPFNLWIEHETTENALKVLGLIIKT